MSRLGRVVLSVFAGFVLALLAIGFVAGRASAQSGSHGDGHAQHHDWYKDLKTRSGWSCCNGDTQVPGGTIKGDCRPVRARESEDGWEAFFEDEWRAIPGDAILPDHLNRVPLTAHVCARGTFVYCFLRSAPGG